MKYVIVLGDGMADEPLEELGGKTPLAYAHTPYMDELAKMSEIGLAKTVPDGMKPGSDTANLSVIGYDPKENYTGRSPLEALSIGVDMKPTDIALRCNIVTLSEEDTSYENRTIIDHSSSEITTEDAAVLLEAVKKALETDIYKYYLGTSYRHLTIWDKGEVVELTPPHDILGRVIKDYLPEEKELREMMEKSFEVLNNHPLNIERAKKGLHKANSIWFWGAGTRPKLAAFEDKFGKKGSMISAVDLLKGIAVGARMKVVEVEGADGTLHTNYEGKAMAAVKELTENNQDFVYIHIEAPDEMGHQGSTVNKIKAIEYIDKRVIGVVKEQLHKQGVDYRMLIMPDHPTPIHLRTHTGNPVPFMLYDSTKKLENSWEYTEEAALKSGNLVKNGYEMILKLFEK
ncbi:2,3-bisphosphoglycerate-independent phosphoglycerate mutase [Anaerocolumna jejuensis DSM 15929]|uniref:2,3-bisphosphoglycerate-independent phosphoglycerate mutase n=1 Tax=Anaerocolumna jejuensis DSM 15929 TaxID=1121322 RepID=A0A1M7C149_9FIRM|nr:cofactor-independent phosphoglycerate mutase [Anaerocolumna jejuensis]SHL60924.1 2,3-bisphosphoglycerate-independent phosphoglycerate mutase [Anaerocolumna jejuensis DSM 15929]